MPYYSFFLELNQSVEDNYTQKNLSFYILDSPLR